MILILVLEVCQEFRTTKADPKLQGGQDLDTRFLTDHFPHQITQLPREESKPRMWLENTFRYIKCSPRKLKIMKWVREGKLLQSLYNTTKKVTGRWDNKEEPVLLKSPSRNEQVALAYIQGRTKSP